MKTSSRNDDELVTLTRASNAIEASLMKSKLESEGVFCFVADGNTIGINPLYTNVLGGLRVQVRLIDVDRACEILQLDEEGVKALTCPQCDSKNIDFSRLPGLLNLLTYLGLGVFFLKLRRLWTCNDCHHNWKR